VTERGPRHVSGCSVEIAAAPRLGVCAEHVALAAAVTEGIAPAAVAIWTAEGDTSPLPCGPCRQVLAELAPAAQVWLKVGGGPPRLLKVHELLPMPFGKDRLPGEGPTP
jgi:cytidine deaminase